MATGNKDIANLNFRFLVATEGEWFIGQLARFLRAVGAFMNKRWHVYIYNAPAVECPMANVPACVCDGFRENGSIMADVNKTSVEFLEQFEPDLFWQAHSRKILWGLVGALAVVVVVVQMQRQAAEREEAATVRLNQVTEPLALQQLAREYKGKAIGAQAYLRLANLQSQAGRFPEALAAYQEFLTVYPHHSLASAAQLGQAASLEMVGKLEDAKMQYAQLATRPNSYTVLAAKLGAARCAENLGQTKEAVQLYEELMPVVAGTQWALPVAIRLDVLARSQETAAISTGPVSVLPTSPSK